MGQPPTGRGPRFPVQTLVGGGVPLRALVLDFGIGLVWSFGRRFDIIAIGAWRIWCGVDTQLDSVCENECHVDTQFLDVY